MVDWVSQSRTNFETEEMDPITRRRRYECGLAAFRCINIGKFFILFFFFPLRGEGFYCLNQKDKRCMGGWDVCETPIGPSIMPTVNR